MTTYEFMVAAKNAVVNELNNGGIRTSIDKLEMVWSTHVLGYKKCLIWGPEMGDYYAEVTYNVGKNEMYLDLYIKVKNKVIDKPRTEVSIT